MLRTVLSALLLGSMAITGAGIAPSLTQHEAVTTAFYSSGAAPTSITISGFGALDNREYPLVRLRALAKQLAREVGLSGRAELWEDTSDQYRVVSLTGTLNDAELTIVVQSLSGYPFSDHAPTTHFLIRVESRYPGRFPADSVHARMRAALERVGTTPEMTHTMTGMIRGQLTKEEAKVVLKKIMDSLAAEVVDTLEAGELLSCCGYTRRLRDSLDVGGESININAALRYNSHAHATNISVATPVINIPY